MALPTRHASSGGDIVAHLQTLYRITRQINNLTDKLMADYQRAEVPAYRVRFVDRKMIGPDFHSAASVPHIPLRNTLINA